MVPASPQHSPLSEASLPGFEEHQFEGRLVDGEVGVSRSAPGRLHAEEAGVELHRPLQVGHVQRKLQSHVNSLSKIIS